MCIQIQITRAMPSAILSSAKQKLKVQFVLVTTTRFINYNRLLIPRKFKQRQKVKITFYIINRDHQNQRCMPIKNATF